MDKQFAENHEKSAGIIDAKQSDIFRKHPCLRWLYYIYGVVACLGLSVLGYLSLGKVGLVTGTLGALVLSFIFRKVLFKTS